MAVSERYIVIFSRASHRTRNCEGCPVLARVIVFFTLLPLVEIAVLVWIASHTSVLFVIGLVLATGLVGAWLVRHQGWHTLARISADLDAGRMPAESLLDGLLVLAAAVLLIVPGVLSDLVAIAILFPPSRRALKSFAWQRMQVGSMRARSPGAADFDGDRIIDVQVIDSPPR
jgi:UPF0716 protein FxsA